MTDFFFTATITAICAVQAAFFISLMQLAETGAALA